MESDRIPCTKCEAMILEITANNNDGLCGQCKKNEEIEFYEKISEQNSRLSSHVDPVSIQISAIDTDKMKPCEPSIEFRVPICGDWMAIDLFISHPEKLLEHYLSCDDEEILAGGFFIDADGRPWSAEENVESMYNANGWVNGLVTAHQSGDKIAVWAWEETNLHIWRRGPLLYMEDDTHHASVRLPKICFDFEKFVAEFIPQAEKLAKLVEILGSLIEQLPIPQPNSDLLARNAKIIKFSTKLPFGLIRLNRPLEVDLTTRVTELKEEYGEHYFTKELTHLKEAAAEQQSEHQP